MKRGGLLGADDLQAVESAIRQILGL